MWADSYSTVATQLCQVAAELHRSGLMQATSGNLSAVAAFEPLRFLITPSGIPKGALRPQDLVIIDKNGKRVGGEGKPSDEMPLHLELVLSGKVGAVIHTHSVWATIVSRIHLKNRGVALEGYEMLKALSGVSSHEHSEWLPILPNTQDYVLLRSGIAAMLNSHPNSHGFLLAGHGLYCWGKDLTEARRHSEALEFLLEAVGRDGGS